MLRPKEKLSPTMVAFPEYPRLETAEEDSLQFLWAVSYCDLLMVLMSFFILFFQVTDTPEKSPLKEIAVKPLKAPPVIAVPIPTNIVDQLGKTLQSENITMSKDLNGKTITMDFDSNLYPPKGYAFPKSERLRLERILNSIKPFSKDLLITFVGHADESRIIHVKNNIIDSNLVLSNLRATRAVEIAYQLGFDPQSVTGQGAGEFSRKTRSLSIKISERRSP